MYSQTQLQAEISAKIELLKRENAAHLSPVWITQAVMADHADIHGEDANFHLCCSRLAVRKEATRSVNKTESPVDPNPQLTLEGFDYLQKYYVVGKGDERVGVRIDLLSDAQLDQKADEYAAMGNTCFAHAAEIRRYKEVRKAQNELAA